MPAKLILAIGLTGLFCLLSALVPLWVLLRRAHYDPGSVVAARRGLVATALIAVIVVCWFAGISTSAGLANVLLVLAAVVGGLVLSVMALSCRPGLLGCAVCLFGGVSWLLTLPFVVIATSFNGPDRVLSMGDGKYCRASRYGGVFGDSGTQIELFRRFAFLEYSIGRHMYSEIESDPEDLQYADKAQLQQCRQKHGLE